MMSQPSELPTVRVLHQMARTGGTVLAKCLASMRGIVVLSEIHPLGCRIFDPLTQAKQWYPWLFDKGEVKSLLADNPSFRDVIMHINQKVQARGKRLLVRDWTHLDFTGVPIVSTPSYRLTTAESLAPGARLVHTACVRHPIDQWISISRLESVRDKLDFDVFMQGCRHFAEEATKIGFVRYEDFTRDPDAALRLLCERLELGFDPGYRKRWADYGKVTGDTDSRGRELRQIRPIPRGDIAPDLIERFASNPDYRAILELLGYSHPC